MRAANLQSDKIALESEPPNGGEPLLIEVMRGGQRVAARGARITRCASAAWPVSRGFRSAIAKSTAQAAYPVRYSKRLKALLEKVRRRVRRSAVK